MTKSTTKGARAELNKRRVGMMKDTTMPSIEARREVLRMFNKQSKKLGRWLWFGDDDLEYPPVIVAARLLEQTPGWTPPETLDQKCLRIARWNNARLKMRDDDFVRGSSDYASAKMVFEEAERDREAGK